MALGPEWVQFVPEDDTGRIILETASAI